MMTFIVKRTFDLIVSFVVILAFFPLLLIISLIILFDDGSPVFFIQTRLGKNWKEFNILKFRTMYLHNNKLGITSSNDDRITPIGKFLRKYKFDELPQFINVLLGDMSIIGPRPEISKYAIVYKKDYDEILKVRPGITDYASIEFRNEGELLKDKINKEEYYLSEILPQKIKLNKKYIQNISLSEDLKIMIDTIKAVIK